MRLLETLTIPGARVFGNDDGYDYMGRITYTDTLGPERIWLAFQPGLISGLRSPRIRFNFNQPRLGRSYSVDQIVINPLAVFQMAYTPPSGEPNRFAINFQIFLNNVAVSPAKSLVYDITSTVGIVDLTPQNSVSSVEPFNSLTILSADTLAVEMSFGFETLPSGPFFTNFKTQFALQLIGDQQRQVALRNE